MKPVRWFRCYSDIKDDPKMLGVSDQEFRIWIHLLALVSEEGTAGVLPVFTEKGIAASLRTTVPKLRAALATFVAEGMVSLDPITITNWSKRQYESDNSTPRVQRFRNGRGNGDETLQKRPQIQRQKQRSETDTETEIITPLNPPASQGERADRARKGSNRKRDRQALAEVASTEEQWLGSYVGQQRVVNE